MKDSGEQDDLWQLLGKAKKNAVSPLFARNVLREIRQSQQEKPGAFSWLRDRLSLHWRLVSLGSVAALLLAVDAAQFSFQHLTPIAAQSAQSALNGARPDDTEVITHLDELVAYEENSIWLEDSSK